MIDLVLKIFSQKKRASGKIRCPDLFGKNCRECLEILKSVEKHFKVGDIVTLNELNDPTKKFKVVKIHDATCRWETNVNGFTSLTCTPKLLYCTFVYNGKELETNRISFDFDFCETEETNDFTIEDFATAFLKSYHY